MIAWITQTALAATLLAAIVWTICRFTRVGPAARHALWLLVLIKLLTPPIVAWPGAPANPVSDLRAADGRSLGTFELLRSLLRDDQPATPTAAGAIAATPAPDDSPSLAPLGVAPVTPAAASKTPTTPATPPIPYWTEQRTIAAFTALWLAGAAAYLSLQALRMARLARHAHGGKPSPSLETALAHHAKTLGMRPPRARTVAALPGPYVWSLLRPRLLWPAGLRYDTPAGQAMLIHELAHLKRRDHWVGWLKLLAGCLWWWHPVYWWTCRRLTEEAELACDAWAVQNVTKARRPYAQALLEVSINTLRPAPALAVGIADGGRSILERRLRMIMQSNVPLRLHRAALAALAILALALVPAWAPSSPATGRARFTLAKDTTVITEPLHADGTPNYVAAVNARFNEGVTPGNNGFTLWLEIVGTRTEDGILSPKGREQLLAMCGAKPTPPGAEVWKNYGHFIRNDKKLDDQRAGVLEDEMWRYCMELWTPDRHPEFAEYLQKNEPWFKKIAEAANRPKWWMPFYTGNESQRPVAITVLLPSLGIYRQASNELAARATLRAAAGDFDGFMQDVLTVKRFSRHLSHQSTMIERLVAAGMNKNADCAIGTVAGSGKLTADQCATLSAALEALPPRGTVAEAFGLAERWLALDAVLWSMTSDDTQHLLTLINYNYEASNDEQNRRLKRLFETVELPELDLDVILRMVNKAYSDCVAIGNASSFAQSEKLAAEISAETQKWVAERNGSANLRKGPNETRADYSARIGRTFLSDWMPSVDAAVRLDQTEVMRDDAARVLLAAAAEKGRTGQWPATYADIVPAKLKDVPTDWFSPDGKAPLKYAVVDQCARVYSLGRTGRDEGGTPKFGGETNIAVGALRRGPIPTPTAPTSPGGLP